MHTWLPETNYYYDKLVIPATSSENPDQVVYRLARIEQRLSPLEEWKDIPLQSLSRQALIPDGLTLC